jgi:hypothetical protein
MSRTGRVAGILSIIILALGLSPSCREAAPPPAPAPDQPKPDPVTVPVVQPFLALVEADAFFYLGMRDWRGLEIFNFVRTAQKLRIIPRFKEMMDPGMPDFPQRAGTERRLRELAELREKVSLRELLGGEFALIVFPGQSGSPPVPALIIRLPEGKAELYTDYFREVAFLFSGEEGAEEDSGFTGLVFYSFPLPETSLRVTWCRAGDILIAAAEAGRVEAIVARQFGRGEASPLAVDRIFQESFRGLDPSARGVFYLSVRPLTEFIAAEISREQARRQDGSVPSGAEMERAGFYLRGIRRLIETVQRIAGTFDFSPEGYREEIRYYLDEENGSPAFLDLVKTAPRSWDVLDYIPAGAADISAGFFDPDKAYRSLLSFIAAGSEEGRAARNRWEEQQAASGIRVEEEILSWLGDEFAFTTFSLPRSLFDPGSWALLFRCESPPDLARFLEDLAERARTENLNVVEEEHGGTAFRVLYLPIPLFPVTPTAGRVGDFLVVASRKDVFTGIVDTYAGQAPSIRQDPDFRRLEGELGNEGSAIFFSRLEDKIEALISTIRSSASMIGLLLPPPGSEGEDGEPLGPDSRQVMDLLNDFTRVLEDLKIFRFRAGVSLYRDGYIQAKSVVEIAR